jgi:hypothetical protein
MNLSLGGTSFNIILIIVGVGLFLLFVVMARMSRNFISWNYSGAGVGFIAGFIAAIFVLVILLSTSQGVLRSILNWKDAPGPIGSAINSSRNSLQNVLGASTEKCEP